MENVRRSLHQLHRDLAELRLDLPLDYLEEKDTKMKIKIDFSGFGKLLGMFRSYRTGDSGIQISYEITHTHSNKKGKATSAKMMLQGYRWASGDTEYEMLEYSDPDKARLHADWMTQVAQQLRKMASEMEEPPK